MSGFKVCYEDTPGGVYIRKVGMRKERRYHVIRWDDMDDACGRDNEGHPRYVASLTEVDLDLITAKQKESVIRSVAPLESLVDIMLAEACVSYGVGAPLGEWSSNNLRTVMKQARAESKLVTSDSTAYETAMNRVVNQLGSTAREYGQGDLNSAMVRGVRNRDVSARIVAKMHGVGEETLDRIATGHDCYTYRIKQKKVPSDDPLAYSIGFIGAVAGQGKANPEGGELAPAYLEGYRDGVSVKNGEKPWPTDWIEIR